MTSGKFYDILWFKKFASISNPRKNERMPPLNLKKNGAESETKNDKFRLRL